MTTPAQTLIPPLSIPDRVRAIRYFSGLNQTELSKLLECSQGTISKLENGELEPTAFHLVRMREVFGVSIDAIVDGLIPYRGIAERFSNSALLPPRYARGAATKLKFLYPLVRAFEQRHGHSRLQKEIVKLGLKPAVFAEPELLVSSHAFHDLIEVYRENGGVDVKVFLQDVQNCVSEVQAALPTGSSTVEEWTSPEKWNIQPIGSDDSAWGARPYANAVLKGLRSGGTKTSTPNAAAALGFRRIRA
jgi:transcriptional regulator with XRE-family HTH domain